MAPMAPVKVGRDRDSLGARPLRVADLTDTGRRDL
jgi:hypothetical protein